jgi:m7GpppX diphosphatase
VHVVHIAHEGFAGMYVGQAHLLEDLISLVSWRRQKLHLMACTPLSPRPAHTQLELSPAPPEKSLIARMTLTYALGTEHGLCAPLLAHPDAKASAPAPADVDGDTVAAA